MKALVMQGDGKASLVTTRPIPQLRSGYLLVKVVCIALNPTDWKAIERRNIPGVLCGCDYAGIVQQLGSGYSKPWVEGDRICGFARGGNGLQPEDGAFAEYIIVKADIQYMIPPGMDFKEAATLGLGLITIGQSLFQGMKLDIPSVAPAQSKENDRQPFLVYGGSTASGALAIQIVKLAGYTPITTCSTSNFAYVKSLGAVAAFDYNDETCAEMIRKYTSGQLKYACDCIADEHSVSICSVALATGLSVRYGSLVPVTFPREDVQATFTVAYLAFGEMVDIGALGKAEGDEKQFQFAKRWVSITEEWLSAGLIKGHKFRVIEGLENVMDGLDQLKSNKVRGEKLIYTV